jgi:hypothetical protein
LDWIDLQRYGEPDASDCFTDSRGGIGDITSDAKGSGARYNTGKMPIELVPVSLIANYEDAQFEGEPSA